MRRIHILTLSLLLCGCTTFGRRPPSNCEIFVVDNTSSRIVLFVQDPDGIHEIAIVETGNIKNIFRMYHTKGVKVVCLDISKDPREAYHEAWTKSGLSIFVFDKNGVKGATVVNIPRIERSSNWTTSNDIAFLIK